MSDHSEFVLAQKEQLEKEHEAQLKHDLSLHEARLKKALKTKEAILADKQDMLAIYDQQNQRFHTDLKEAEELGREEAIKQDIHAHEEFMERAAHIKQELAEMKQAEFERFERDLEEHRQKAAFGRPRNDPVFPRPNMSLVEIDD